MQLEKHMSTVSCAMFRFCCMRRSSQVGIRGSKAGLAHSLGVGQNLVLLTSRVNSEAVVVTLITAGTEWATWGMSSLQKV